MDKLDLTTDLQARDDGFYVVTILEKKRIASVGPIGCLNAAEAIQESSHKAALDFFSAAKAALVQHNIALLVN